MAGRTFAIGDIHGERAHFDRVWAQLPPLDADDTVVFLGDYVNRGPHAREVLEILMALPLTTPAHVVFLRGNHEDAWLRVRGEGWDEFVLVPEHGCFSTLRSFTGGPPPQPAEKPSDREMGLLASGIFLPDHVVEWMAHLPFWYEDERAIYLHAGLPRGPEGFLHPSAVSPAAKMAWVRTDDFVRNYRGKKVVFGHTPVTLLPTELSVYTPDDPDDAWVNENVVGLDTGCGLGGFLTAVELPSMKMFESRPKKIAKELRG
ncbi:MAG TPA: metallophosphoesterase family protein [Opitutaceae bacterium]|nr:metallophosphoesterase family protein [Opitutaceae bacterium]